MQGYHGDVFSGLPDETSVSGRSNNARLVEGERPNREQPWSPGWGLSSGLLN